MVRLNVKYTNGSSIPLAAAHCGFVGKGTHCVADRRPTCREDHTRATAPACALAQLRSSELAGSLARSGGVLRIVDGGGDCARRGASAAGSELGAQDCRGRVSEAAGARDRFVDIGCNVEVS